MKPVRNLFLGIGYFLALLTAVHAQPNKPRYQILQKTDGSLMTQVETGVGTGSYTTVPNLVGRNPVRTAITIMKPVSRAYPTADATVDNFLYPDMRWPDNFRVTGYYRRTDETLSPNQFRQFGYLEATCFTDAEKLNPALRARIYQDIPGGVLGIYEQGAAFTAADLQTVMNQFAPNLGPHLVGVARISFNFEQSYMPNMSTYSNPGAGSDFNQKGVLQHWPDAETRQILCESNSIKGQTMTLRALWDSGKFNEEFNQRQVNRLVALLRLTQQYAGATTQVANGDGPLVYQNGSVAYDDNYEATYAANTSRAYLPYVWDLPANFDPISVIGRTVTNGGKRFWDAQDWLNNYSYVGQAYLSSADFDLVANTNIGYEAFWNKLEPGPGQDDVNIPSSFHLNRRRMINFGRPNAGIVWQGHSRLEFGVRRKGTEDVTLLYNFGPDGAVVAPYLAEVHAIVCRMVAEKADDGMTIWSTIRQGGPGVSDYHNSWSARKMWERMGYRTGLTRLYKFKEYFDPVRQPKLFHLDDVYVRYLGVAGGDWGTMKTSGGNGFWKRGAGYIVNHQNPSDNRTKCGIMTRIIWKNNAPWMLVTGTNHRQGRNETSNAEILVKASDVPGMSADVIIPVAIVGWQATVMEVCLEPAKLGTLAGGGVTVTPPAGTTTGNNDPNAFWGFAWAPIAETARPSNNKAVLISGDARMENWLDYGGSVCHISEGGGPNLMNHADHGREGGIALYYKTGPFLPGGRQPHPAWYGIGWNPIEAGDVYNNGSEILAYGVASDGTQYIKSRPKHWPLNNYADPHTVFEKWTKPLGNGVFRVWQKAVVNRTDDLTQPDSHEQELPYTYPIREASQYHFYEGSSPWTNGGTTVLENQDRLSQKVAENWVASVSPSTGSGFGLVSPDGYNFTIRNFSGGNGGETGDATGYMAVMIPTIAGPSETHLLTYDYVVGTAQKVRSHAYSWPRVANLPHFIFDTGRKDCTFEKGTYSMVNNALVLEHKTRQIGISTPYKPFVASSVTNIYVRIKNESPDTDLVLKWYKPGQRPIDTVPQSVFFSVANDGQYHTVALPVSANNLWSGTILQLTVNQANVTTEAAVSNRRWHIKWLSHQDLPANN